MHISRNPHAISVIRPLHRAVRIRRRRLTVHIAVGNVCATAMKGTGPWRERCREPRYAEKRDQDRQKIRPLSFAPNATGCDRQ